MLVINERVTLDDVYSARGLDIPYPAAPRQRCDWCLGSGPSWEWAIEAKMRRLFGDNGGPFIYLMDSVSVTGCTLTDTEMTAQEALLYAARDLEGGSGRGAVNALGNVKRALHLTVDSLLQAHGLLAHNRRLAFRRSSS